MNKRSCIVTANAKTFQIITQIQLAKSYQVQIQISNAVDNPISTQPTDSWSISTSVGESDKIGINLQATAGLIEQFQIIPGSTVVGASTNVIFQWIENSFLPSGTYFQINLPLWNPNALKADMKKSYLQGQISCTAVSAISNELQCNFQNGKLLISGGVTTNITANNLIKVNVTGFKNPIDTSLISGFSVQSQIIGQNGLYYPIDIGNTSLQVTDYAPLSKGILEVLHPEDKEGGIIQHSDEMRLSFYLPVPLDAGCQLTVTLPIQYNVTTVQKVGSLQAFGSYQEFNISDQSLAVNILTNSFSIDPCKTYTENADKAVLQIFNLTQFRYEKSTDSIQIQIHNSAGYKVASISTGVTFLAVRGGIQQVLAKAVDASVQSSTQIEFSIQPQHYILISDMPMISISFPILVDSSKSCTVTGFDTGAQCKTQGQTLTISNWLSQDYTLGQFINFTIGNVINPNSTKLEIGGDLNILIQTQSYYAIDEWEDKNIPWELQPGSFTFLSIDPGSYLAHNADNTYIIRFQPQHSIQQNSFITIKFPEEISIPDTSYSQSSCAAVSGFPLNSQITCEIENNILSIYNAFRTIGGASNTLYVITVPGVLNPINTKPTGSFTLQTLTADQYLIDFFTGGNIQMTESAEIQNVHLQPSQFVNSYRATYNITLIPSVPVKSSDYFMITFPAQIILPPADQLACNTTYQYLFSSISCSIYPVSIQFPNTVKITFTLVNQSIDEMERIGFSINNLQNPSTTQTTDSVQIQIINEKFEVMNQKLQNITVTTTQPFPIQKASISSLSEEPGISTTYFITFYPEHQILKNGGLLITIPIQIQLSEGQIFKVNANVSNQETDNSKIITITDISARAIYVYNVIQTTFNTSPENLISLSISNFTNPFTDLPSDSFKVTSYNNISSQYSFSIYLIDTANQGLVIKSSCDYPCNTCEANNTQICTSCFQEQGDLGLPYLQNGTCVSECNFGRYLDKTGKCEICSSKCLQCYGTADSCTICGGQEFPYYLNSSCLYNCPAGYLNDFTANRCQKCAQNCQSCNNTINTCTLCDKNGSYPFLFKNDCLSSCTADLSVQVKDECVQCDTTCQTCTNTTDTCTSCAQHMKFDPIGHVCTQECLAETQIYNPDQETCDTCNSNCTTCQGDVNKCTACKPGFVLNTNFSCQTTCNNDNQTPINNICAKCEEPCYGCYDSVNQCTSCLQSPIKYYLYKNTQCLQYCPVKYNISDDGLFCQYIGLICPQNFTGDKEGNSCIPILKECSAGFELNEEKTSCVPKPGSPIPFPFLIASVFVSALVLGSYLKEKFFTKVYTCLICIIGSFELIQYALMVVYSASAEEWGVCALCLVGLISQLTANATFFVYYSRDIIKNDEIYAKWLYFYPKTKQMIPIMSILNFKCSKILYSGFFGLESSMAKFGKPLNYYQIMRMCTNFSFIFTYGFIFIADIVILAKTKWGNQLMISAIETIILQIFIIVLNYFESKISPAELLSVGSTQYTSINPKKIFGEIKVKAGAEEQQTENDYDEGVPDVDEKTLLRSKEHIHLLEVSLRSKAFTKLINQVKYNCKANDPLLSLMTKFDDKLLKRGCLSLQGDKQEWSSDEDTELQRRNSWPLVQKIEIDQLFDQQIENIIIADEEFLIDNCIAVVRKEKSNDQNKNKKLVSRRTQTYLRDLLYLEFQQDNYSQLSIIMDNDAEIDNKYTIEIIKHVIDNLSGNEQEDDFEQQIVQHEIPEDDTLKQIELQDIMGEFEIDDLGNFVINRAIGSNDLCDKLGRKVNKRGYLVDKFGNVIDSKGNIIYKVTELVQDDEILETFDSQNKTVIQTIEEVQVEDALFTLDEMPISKVVHKKLKKKVSHSLLDNLPPKRITQNNSQNLYPVIEIDYEQKRKLSNIADSISSVTQKLALENNFAQINNNRYEEYLDQKLLQRPQMRQRPQTSNINMSKRLQSSGNQRIQSAKIRDETKQIYSHHASLVDLKQQKSEIQSDKSRNELQQQQSELARISEIYLNSSLVKPITIKKSNKPFRPLMHQFQDDPSELKVQTMIVGKKDTSFNYQERNDQISYLNRASSLQERGTTVMTNPIFQKDLEVSEFKQSDRVYTPFQGQAKKPITHNWFI